MVSAHDVGTIINPLAHCGQLEGGMIQGFGFAMSEDLATEDGKVVTANLGEYKLPNIRDIPEHETLYVRDHTGPGPFQAKQIGEHGAIPTAAAIANAVDDAIGVQITDLPITVRFIGERVAVVAAQTPDVAEEALSRIVVDYEEMKSVHDPIEAMEGAISDGSLHLLESRSRETTHLR